MTWNAVIGATSYTLTSNFAIDLIIHANPLATSARAYYPLSDNSSLRTYTLNASTPCSHPTTSISVYPCFLAGNLVISGSHTYHVDGYAVTGWPREDDFNYDNWATL